MLTDKERLELESLKRDPYVNLATKSMQKAVDPEKKRLYQYRWLQKKGKQIANEIDSDIKMIERKEVL